MKMRFKDFLSLSEEMSEHNIELLYYLVHDKDRIGSHLESIDLKPLTASTKPLYRGVYSGEFKIYKNNIRPGGKIVFNRITSFSEDFKIARSFASSGYILESTRTDKAFCYYDFLSKHIEDIKRIPPGEHDSLDDPEAVVRYAQEEKEWLIPKKSTFNIVEVYQQDGLTFVKGTIN